MKVVSRKIVNSSVVQYHQNFYLDAVLIRFQIGKPKRATNRDRLGGCYSVVFAYVR